MTARVAAKATQYGAALLRPRWAWPARRAAEMAPSAPAITPNRPRKAVQPTTGHQDGGSARAAFCISSGYGTSS
jgi:hypothetical protein